VRGAQESGLLCARIEKQAEGERRDARNRQRGIERRKEEGALRNK